MSNNFGFQGGGGSSTPTTAVESVTGLNTDNTDPQNPIVEISVDGTTITGDGTPANPLEALNNLTLTTTGTSGASTLVGDTLNIPQYAGVNGKHIPIKPVSGYNYGNGLITGAGTFGNSGNIMYLTPFLPSNTLTIVSTAIQVTTLGAGNTMKIVVYSDNNGLPSTKLLESTALDISTIGFKTFVTSFTFTGGETYWVGVVAGSSSGAITSNSQTMVFAYPTTSNGSFNGMSFTINYPTIPATLTPIIGNLASISSQPRVTFISA